VVVDPHWQGKGIGSSMIRNLKHLAKSYFHLEMISTEVFEGNPIISLLLKNGFQEVFRQEKFVKEKDVYKARIFLETKL
jgi:putative acetyltransferase